MKFRLEPFHRNVSDADLIEDLKSVCAKLKTDTVTYNQYDKDGKFRSRTLEVRFGSWNSALQKAGLRIGRTVGFTRDELLENIRLVWIELGRQPRQNEMVSPVSQISNGTYSRHFGTWRKALEAFIDWVNDKPGAQRQEAQGVKGPRRDSTPRQASLRLKFKVMRRDDFRCKYCGRSPSTHPGTILHVDHIRPWSKGGKTSLDNLQTLCEKCNLGKSNLNPSEHVKR